VQKNTGFLRFSAFFALSGNFPAYPGTQPDRHFKQSGTPHQTCLAGCLATLPRPQTP